MATLATQIFAFLDSHPGETFSVFTVAAHVGGNPKSVKTRLAALAIARKVRKERKGFYSSIKSPNFRSGFSETGELHP